MSPIPALILAAILPQEVSWRKSWPEALAEAKKTNSLAVLVFFNKGLRDCRQYESETLADPKVVAALNRCVCVMVDPEGTDDDNRLWQEHQMPRPPMTYVYGPDGKLLTTVSALAPRHYAEGIDAALPAYFEMIAPAREALAKDPAQPARHATLGLAYARLNNPQESSGHYAKAVELLEGRGDRTGALETLSAQLARYYESKWYVHARGCARKILDLDPTNKTGQGPMAAWVLGMADCDERRWADAIAGLKAACEKYRDWPNLHKILFSLGAAYMYSNSKDAALDVFDRIILEYPESESAELARIQAGKLRGN